MKPNNKPHPVAHKSVVGPIQGLPIRPARLGSEASRLVLMAAFTVFIPTIIILVMMSMLTCRKSAENSKV